MNDELLTPKEAAELLKVTVQWIYQQKAKGTIPYRKLGGSVRFFKNELLTWVDNSR